MMFFTRNAVGIRNVDIFVLINMLLMLFMCVLVYYHRFIAYRGAANLHEFFIYAVAIFAVVGVAWLYLRHFPFSNSILLLLQFGIMMHFAGAFFPLDGGRLYDAIILGIRYDKYVHFVNAFAAAALTSHLFSLLKVHIPLIRNLIIVLTVMGLGAVVEIVEYLVVLTVPDAGVGGYHNNMRDLIANMAGGICFITVSFAWNPFPATQPKEHEV